MTGELDWLQPERPALEVARDMLGAQLCRRLPSGEIIRFAITEVEAYIGPEDKACHAAKGRTPRTEVMFAEGGSWYVYLCYGVHWLVNLVTGSKDFPAAVLLRGVGSIAGPGRLTKAMAITGELNAMPATKQSGLWIEQGMKVPESEIFYGPRVGIGYAGEEWVAKPYRMIWKSEWAGRLPR